METGRADRLRRRIARQHGIPVADEPIVAAAGTAANIVEAFEAVVRRFEDRPAVRCAGRQVTYRQLDTESSRLAAAIATSAGSNTAPVAVLLDRSPEMIVAALAAVKAGRCYVPLDSATPAGRIALILDDASPSVVVTSSALAGIVPPGVSALLIERRWPTTTAVAPPRIDGSAPAYVIFTSGTTGRPKGAQVSHSSLLHLIAATGRVFGFGASQVWTMFHSFGFDFAIWETWGPLLTGGCVVIVPHDVARDPVEFRRLLRAERVTVMNQTPKAFNQLIDEDQRHPDRLPLRCVLLGGEALRFADLRAWVAKYGDRAPRLVNIYGPSETTVIASYHPIAGDELHRGTSVIGRPLPGLDFVLVDDDLAPVPPGTVGEIVITGPSVAIGYLARPEQTQERFIELNDHQGNTVRGYRTGDLAALNADGDHEYRGRNDDQVKIRGFRVEPAEVEAALAALPAVANVAVIPRELPDLGTSLVAYLVTTGRGDTSPAALRGALVDLLPEYMMPRAFVMLDELPLNHHGKVDRAALPSPTLPAPRSRDGDADIESTILGIVRALLHTDDLEPTADFFAAGGHSLLVTRVLAHVRAAFAVDLPLRVFFRDPTVRALAAAVRRERAAAHRAPRGQADILRRAPHQEHVPLTAAQRRLYFIARLDPENTAYLLHTTVLLDGPVDVDALERAFGAVLARHAPLRTVVRVIDGEPMAHIRPATDFRLPVEVFPAGVPDTWPQRLTALAEREAATPFDLEADLMLRARLMCLAPHRYALLVTLHHIAADGWSVAVLSRELTELYRHFRSNPDDRYGPPLPAPFSYPDFAFSVNRWLDTPGAEPDIAYWTHRLAGLPRVHLLPLDKPRPDRMGYRGASLELVMGGGRADALRRLCRDENVTMFMLMEAAFAVVLARRGAGVDVAFGTAAANRSLAALDGLIGLFVNTLVTRISLADGETFHELLDRVSQQTLDDLEHQHVPFDVVVKRMNPHRSTAELPLFQIMLVVQNNEPMTLELDGVEVTPLALLDRTVKVDLLLEVIEQHSDVRFRWTYNTDLFHRGTVAAMAAEVDAYVGELAADPARRHAPLAFAGAPPRGRRSGRTVGLFPLRRAATRAPAVVAVPGGLGLGSSFVQLAAHIADRDVHALDISELADRAGSTLTLATLIDACVEGILAAGDGPLHLVGHSIGGTVAFHLVGALQAAGRPLLTLSLLDSPPPVGLDRILGGTRRSHLWSFLGSLAQSFPDAAQRWRDMGLAAPEANGDDESMLLTRAESALGKARLELLHGDLTRAFASYLVMRQLDWPEPEPLSCPALLLRADGDPHEGPARLSDGWRDVLPMLSEDAVPASHEGILRHPHAAPVAAVLSRFMLANERPTAARISPPSPDG